MFKVGDRVWYRGSSIRDTVLGKVVPGEPERLGSCYVKWDDGVLSAATEELLELVDNHPASDTGAQREKLNVLTYDLVPFQEITDAYTRVAEFGAKKYAAWNWSKGLPRVQILGSLLRHTFAYLRGEECDSDSGLSHTDHIIWNAATLVHNVHWNLADGRRVEPHRDYKKTLDRSETNE